MFSRLFGKKDEAPAPPAEIAAKPATVHDGHAVKAFRTRAVQAVAAGTLPPEAFRHKGAETAPGEGAARTAWINAAIDRALALPLTCAVYALDHHFLTALSEHVEENVDLDELARHPDGFCMAFERMATAVASRHAWYAATGERAERRIELETEILRDLDRKEVVMRFELTPPARVEGVPIADISLREWIADMLRGEAIAIAAGLVPPTDVARIACVSRLPTVHVRPEDGSRIAVSFPGYHPDLLDRARHHDRATHLGSLSRQIVLSRFTALPGFDSAATLTRGQDEWTMLIERALLVEEVREVSGIALIPAHDEDVELIDVELRPDDDGMGFSGILHVFGDRVCRLTGTGDGSMFGDEWTEGCSSEDIDTLDGFIAATGEPREDGEMPDSLAMRILDIVAVHTLIEAYMHEREGHAIFALETPDGDILHYEPIHEGQTLAEVVEAFRSTAPRAVSLDDLEDLEAAELWLSLRD